MASTSNKQRLTGRRVALIFVAGFGIVAAVNFTMASLAVGGFHGVVVNNSYVASQNFNRWLEAAEASKALGWKASAERGESGHVTITTQYVPEGAVVSAELRRPIGEHAFASLDFAPKGGGTFASTQPVDAGRWTMRLTITSGDDVWISESEL
ncbi:FixH family protein [Erythrobacter sp. SCSIO 43205]|uniref:FixH family protein n=1 Tax=Erythrobacter sp. SCSIO 43205 TaxID=2779361 RepID=UPI001CA81D32|nr:FixH family protein [Erythrobacter sp. SCSIO 43205]UAB78899.1 FixH family protein [Erythrobacter sp. SCSIO 43205]